MSNPEFPLESYRPPEDYYDEFLDGDLRPRPHWQAFADIVRHWGSDEFTGREEQMRRIIRENGITYNVYSEGPGESRPWTMDLLPLVFQQEEWNRLGESLGQRAELLNLIYKDVYGSQSLLKSGLLPPHLILANPHFCRPCHRLAQNSKHPIHLYAADLARSPDGNWWVLSDRLEASSGLGYSLENRFISTRVFPGIIRQLGVGRLNKFIDRLCSSYEGLAPLNKENPRIVLLTPGPANETYFEQSYLARNLGYTLVEGADLTVRDNRVYLKTIGGVKEVDVIIRRVDTPWCDPLELRNDSFLGVPGLVDVIRSGRVTVANALGSSLLESPALPAFLPSLCRQLLGEDLKIPSVASWWCGQPREMAYVLDNLQFLVLKTTFRVGSGELVFGPGLSKSALNTWKERIKRTPRAFSAQEMVAQATTPVYQDGSFHSRHFLLRVFLVPTENGWEIMPGGLARIASGPDSINVSMQKGGESKDVWVLGHREDSQEPARSDSVSIGPNVRRESFDLPSRVADNFFWLGRYVERTESIARVIQIIWESLIEHVRDSDLSVVPLYGFFPETKEKEALTTGEPPCLDMQVAEKTLSLQIRDSRNQESLVSNFRYLAQASSKVKERLSAQSWQQLIRLNELTRAASTQRDVFDEETNHILSDALHLLAGFNGLMMENMTRGQNWLFLEIGKRLERSLVLLHLLKATLCHKHEDEEEVLWKLLDCADSSMTYRRRYLTQINAETVLDLLISEGSNPRSLAFQMDELQKHIKELPHSLFSSMPNAIDLNALKAFSRIGLADHKALLEVDADGQRPELVRFVDEVSRDLVQVSTKIEQQYFAHTKPASIQRAHHQNL
ncbi:MAG TPA: circularly permuted type 2 ATP-grasp protein [Oceanipulchritudo sp.]|nr:circularly permuted type 2 ATP-grasp protein [Oceanipulchritudo sp.]